MYIIADNEATYFEGESIKTVDQLPLGVWGIGYRPMTNAPYFYKMNDYKTSHGKIYGDMEKFAQHVIDAYNIETDKNVGALFSGKKGLGKSLTIRLIVEKMVTIKPVIVIDKYVKFLPSVLSNIKDCVIVLDEFEKMFKKGSDDSDGMTPQESLLSILDGTKSLSHNLYLLSVNDVFSLDENLISRPGRIRYHFRYENISEDSVRAYCKDNLIEERWKDIEDVVQIMKGSSVQSLDIVQSIVKEMNAFKDMDVTDIVKIMNIGENKFEISVSLTISIDGHFTTIEDTLNVTTGIVKSWIGDDVLYAKFKLKDISYKPILLQPTDYSIERWRGFYPTDISKEDPFWKQFIDNDESDVWIPMDETNFRKKHNVKVEAFAVSRKLEFGAF